MNLNSVLVSQNMIPERLCIFAIGFRKVFYLFVVVVVVGVGELVGSTKMIMSFVSDSFFLFLTLLFFFVCGRLQENIGRNERDEDTF